MPIGPDWTARQGRVTFPAALSPGEWTRVQRILSTESVGGVLLLAATVLALVLANSRAGEWYATLSGTYVGGEVLGMDFSMSLAHWSADGLLAIFFFLVGLELKREFVSGDLRRPAAALVPVAAAVGGVALPAAIYLLVTTTTSSSREAAGGWAIPAATDIAFALAVLAVVGRHLPTSLRTFLLTLAVVDDLIAITIIALFYTVDPRLAYLLVALVPLALYGVIARRGDRRFREHPWVAWAVLLPLGIVVWGLVYQSGVHATIAGVLLAFAVPVRDEHGEASHGLAETLEHRYRPLSAGIAVPVFAFFSAGVALGGWSGLADALANPVALGIMTALVVGKAVGITGATFLVTRLQHARLDPSLRWADIVGVSLLAGIGFTVSLLISELSFTAAGGLDNVGKVGVLCGSLLAATLASLVLGTRSRAMRGTQPVR